jgi:hypothetical protein
MFCISNVNIYEYIIRLYFQKVEKNRIAYSVFIHTLTLIVEHEGKMSIYPGAN